MRSSALATAIALAVSAAPPAGAQEPCAAEIICPLDGPAVPVPVEALLACGGPATPCPVEGGQYRLALPIDPRAAPVVVFLHGYAASGQAMLGNDALAAAATARGYAFVAPDGQPARPGAPELDWSVEDGMAMPRDDVAFLNAVIADATARFGLDRNRVLVAGFSRGGSMVWDLACKAPGTAAAYAAIAGGFWEPMATSCAGPVHLHHSHGFADRTVPLEGRTARFGGTDFHQGNVVAGLDVWRRGMGCTGNADAVDTAGPLWTKAWTTCAAGSITFSLGPGGHAIPDGWTTSVLDWFEALPPPGHRPPHERPQVTGQP
jgi:polyhydroxybutyrate depolymerase